MIGFTLTGDIEGGPVINRGANEWQPDGDVDGLAEGETLDGDQSLVVIAGDDDVELAARRAQENGVAGEGAADVDVIIQPAGFDGRDHLRGLLKSEQPALAAVRVERRDCDARLVESVAQELTMHEPDQAFEARLPDLLDGFGQ